MHPLLTTLTLLPLTLSSGLPTAAPAATPLAAPLPLLSATPKSPIKSSVSMLVSASALPAPTLLASPPRPPAQGLAAACALVVVQRGDTAHAIARRYGVTPDALQLDSAQGPRPLVSAWLPRGEVVRVALPLASGRPAPGIRQVQLRSGDTLSRVEARYSLSEQELVSANLELRSLDKLSAGSTLNIPTGVRGLLLTIKPGQNVVDLIRAYHADPLWTARVNKFTLPTELKAGDQLLLPGIFARSLTEELLARRARAAQQAQQARVLARYQAFLAWKAAKLHARQLQYERYQAWLKSPEHLAAVEKLRRQAEYDAWAAHQAKVEAQAAAIKAAEQAAEQARQQALQQQLAQQAAEQAQQGPGAAPLAGGQGEGGSLPGGSPAEQATSHQAALRLQMAQLASGDPRPQMQLAVAAERNAPDLNIIWPLEHSHLTSRFGEEDIDFHKEFFHGGQDIAAPIGTPIHAATGGTVAQSGEGAYGLNVYIHQGPNIFIYGHMSQIVVTVGQVVHQGDLIGYVGCTGECTGPHLHFEIRLGGVPVDPLAFLP